MVHAIASAAGRLLVERRRDVLVERRREHRRDVAVRHLQIDAADLLVGNAVDEDAGLLGDLLEGLLDDAGRDRQERQRVEQARGGRADVFADRLEQGVRRVEWGENATLASMLFKPRSVSFAESVSSNVVFVVEVVVERGERQVHGLLSLPPRGRCWPGRTGRASSGWWTRRRLSSSSGR